MSQTYNYMRVFILKMAKWFVYTQTPVYAVYGNGCVVVIVVGILLVFSLINNRSHTTKSSIAIDRAQKFSLGEKINTAMVCVCVLCTCIGMQRMAVSRGERNYTYGVAVLLQYENVDFSKKNFFNKHTFSWCARCECVTVELCVMLVLLLLLYFALC